MSARVPAALLPQLMANGKWRGPAIKPRMASMLRKKAIVEKKYFLGADLSKGEWDPSWDRANKAVVSRENKGRINWRTRDERVAKIEEAMATMDEKIEEMHMERINKKPLSFIEKEFIKNGYFKQEDNSSSKKKKEKKKSN